VQRIFSEALLDFSNIGGLEPFGACDHIESYGFTFSERFEPFALDGGEMYEYIFTVVLLDESKTLCVVEPFYFPLCHFPTSFGASGPLPELRDLLQLPES
jgi:hypothetical protein